MDTLDRYLIREFLMFFLVTLFGLGVLYVAIDFLSHFWNMSLPMMRVLELHLYKVPAALNQFVPVSCLMATLLVIAAMSKQNEILALYSGGVSNLRIISTFIAIVATVSTIAFLTFDPLVPSFAKKQYLVANNLDPSQEIIMSSNKSSFWYRSGQIIYNVGHFNPDTNTLENLNVFALGANFSLLTRTHAKKAVYNGTDWILEDGFTIHYPDASSFPYSEKFRTLSQLIPEKPGDYKTLKVQEETMRLKELRKYINRNRSYGLDTTAQQVHYHERVALIFAPLIFVLLAMGFSLKPLKTHSMAKSVSFCFIVVFIYLISFRMSLSIGRGGHIPAFLAGWVPNLAFLALSSILIMRR